MFINRITFCGLVIAAAAGMLASAAAAPDINGQWEAAIESAVGVQNYVYVFKVEGAKVTGIAKSDGGDAPLEDGKIEGNQISFNELRNFDGNRVKIEYKGKIVSGQEIQFTRFLEAFGATEQFAAKRAK